jgi:hypothetical protein
MFSSWASAAAPTQPPPAARARAVRMPNGDPYPSKIKMLKTILALHRLRPREKFAALSMRDKIEKFYDPYEYALEWVPVLLATAVPAADGPANRGGGGGGGGDDDDDDLVADDVAAAPTAVAAIDGIVQGGGGGGGGGRGEAPPPYEEIADVSATSSPGAAPLPSAHALAHATLSIDVGSTRRVMWVAGETVAVDLCSSDGYFDRDDTFERTLYFILPVAAVAAVATVAQFCAAVAALYEARDDTLSITILDVLRAPSSCVTALRGGVPTLCLVFRA